MRFFQLLLGLLLSLSTRALAVDCSQGFEVNRGVSKESIDYFRGLYAKGLTAPLDDFLTLWLPEVGDGSALDSPLFTCERNSEFGFEIPYDLNDPGQLRGTKPVPVECRPDVLYAWGSISKSQSLLKRFADGEKWEGIANPHPRVIREGMIVTTMSAVSTFGFGQTLLRYKMKASAPYAYFSFDADVNQVRVISYTYHEFEFKNAALVESVSFGTPEIYDEVVRDILRFKSVRRAFVYSSQIMGNRPDRTPNERGLERLYNQNVDNHVQTEVVLKANLLELIREILAGEGKAHFSDGACRNQEETFSTRFPSYIQPRKSRL